MSKNTNKSNNELNKSSSNISDIINKIQTESQKLFVFPSDIVSMIIDKFTKYFNNDLSNVRCCDICSGNYEFINEFIKLKVKSITTKYLDNNLIKYYDELFNELKNKTNIKFTSKKHSLNDINQYHLIICNLLNITRDNEQQIKVIKNFFAALRYHKNICFCVIPEELISDCDRFNRIKSELSGSIMEIIQCNSEIFYPKYYSNNINANRYCILLLKTYDIEYRKFNVKVTNYYNDGYRLINIDGKNKRIKTTKSNITIHNTYDFKINNWFDVINKDVNINLINNEVLNSMLCYYKHKYNKAMINYMIHENLFNVQNGGRQNEKCRLKRGVIETWKEIKLSDVLEYVNVNTFDRYCESGIYPLIMHCRDNNGMVKYIDQYSYNDVSITITIDNPILCYYHNYPVAIDKSTRLFRIKDKSIDPHLLTVLINYELINKDYEVISVKEIMEMVIYVPSFVSSPLFQC